MLYLSLLYVMISLLYVSLLLYVTVAGLNTAATHNGFTVKSPETVCKDEIDR